MRRREFITLLGGAAAVLPLAARAQQSDRSRRVGALWTLTQDNAEMQARLAGFRLGLERFGWSPGRNIRLEDRFAEGGNDQFQPLAKELIGLQPDVIVAQSTPVAEALQRETREIPIVFFAASDPIGSRLVASLARPGGNLTGVLLYEEGIVGKWLAMLKEMAPRVVRAALLANPKTTAYDYFVRSAKATAPALALELVPSPIGTAAEIENSIVSFAQVPNSGLIVLPDSTNLLYRDLIIALAARHSLPAVYAYSSFAAVGGLISYSTNAADQNRQIASFVDRILRGAKAADLPVEQPTKYETTVNVKTAKTLGLTVPPSLLARADEVIE